VPDTGRTVKSVPPLGAVLLLQQKPEGTSFRGQGPAPSPCRLEKGGNGAGSRGSPRCTAPGEPPSGMVRLLLPMAHGRDFRSHRRHGGSSPAPGVLSGELWAARGAVPLLPSILVAWGGLSSSTHDVRFALPKTREVKRVARKARFPRISAEEAHAALKWLHALGKVSSRQIVDALRGRDRLVTEIKARLEQLGGEGARFLNAASFSKPAPKRRAKRVSAAVRAARRTQGRYLGAVGRLSKADRVKVKTIREKKGVRAAIAAAKRLVPR
jgi:hypothetical protein